MERIKQALERARKERETAVPGGRARLVRGPGVITPKPDRIEYTETEVFKPDPRLLDKNRVLGGASAEMATDAYRMLRTRVLQRMKENQWNSLMITSPGAAEGKSLTAVNLAISLAREVTHTVLLVDLDLRRPGIHKFFGYEPKLGVTDYLRDSSPLSEILFNPSIDRLVILPGRERVENSSELLSSPEMIELINDIKSRYSERIVIFDLPPVLATDDALAFSPNVDATLLVVADGQTKQDELASTYEVLSETNVVGVVMNQSAEPSQAYYY